MTKVFKFWIFQAFLCECKTSSDTKHLKRKLNKCTSIPPLDVCLTYKILSFILFVNVFFSKVHSYKLKSYRNMIALIWKQKSKSFVLCLCEKILSFSCTSIFDFCLYTKPSTWKFNIMYMIKNKKESSDK